VGPSSRGALGDVGSAVSEVNGLAFLAGEVLEGLGEPVVDDLVEGSPRVVDQQFGKGLLRE
jgi:hypothetical protein